MNNIIKQEEFYDVEELLNEINRNELNISFNEIYEYFINAKVTLTEEEIKNFLLEKAKEANIDMSEKPRKKRINNASEIDIEEFVEEFKNKLIKSKYILNDYDLIYFKRYVEILKIKSIKFCSLIKLILNKQPIEEMKKILPDFENAIIMKEGKINGDSISRLKEVILRNYVEIKKKINKANSLNTYLKTVINLELLHKDGWTEMDLYPSSRLQNTTILFECEDKSCLAFSPKQIESLKIKANDNFMYFVKNFSLKRDK